ncbi:MAG: NAD(P)H-hydrate dehydratase [Azoarcus sp.]|jgi:hydroxyethylthiazole kinase-like uncharacterized protein yjeF|nr:NAD(P)H-hydrate dehydratase [Azoarcus sp.]
MSLPIYPVRDIRAIERRFLPNAQPSLMARAGHAAALDALRLGAGRLGAALVLCGPGNNGGDGFVLARELRRAKRETAVVFAGEPERLPADAAHAYATFRAEGGVTVPDLPPPPEHGWAFVVDALFGIGLERPIEGRYAAWIGALDTLPHGTPILAIDAPSGLEADTGRRLGACVRATHTVTFIALKPGLLTLDGPDQCGEILLRDLGLNAGDAVPAQGHLIDRDGFASHLTPRPKNSHKGMYGDACVLGGAAGMTGAALLAARAALMLGAGRVYACLLDAAAPGVDLVQPELMLRLAGHLPEHISACAAGPGLGSSEEAERLLRTLVGQTLPLVLDADALNLISRLPDLATAVQTRTAATVLTPHPAEAARLLATDTAAVQADRIAAARELARRHRAYIVLKGCGAIVAAPDGRWFINTSGHAGMASAGMGDVLSGLVLALLAQSWPAEAALIAAVHLHGVAAERLAAQSAGPLGLTAGETIAAARATFNDWIAHAHA